MSQETTTTVRWEDLGDAATSADIRSLAEAVREASHDDSRIENYALTIVRDGCGDDLELRVNVTGTVTAKDFVAEVFAGAHGEP